MIPEEFFSYFFRERVDVIKALCESGRPPEDFLIGFTRTSPAVITDGPAGLSGSIKMVGFVPKKEFIEELAERAYELAYVNRPKGMREVSYILLKYFYREDVVDPHLIGGLEMGFSHSWININHNHKATLLFFTPPIRSFEVRTSVEIHMEDDDPYKKYLNSLHDLFHWGGVRSNFPAYIFKIEEIYDNSASREGFGRMIYPRKEKLKKIPEWAEKPL